MIDHRTIVTGITVSIFLLTVIGIRHGLSRSGLPVHAGLVEEAAPGADTSGDFAPLPRPKPGDWLACHSEAGQTFEQFLAQPRNRLDADRTTMYLQPIWDFDTSNGPPLEPLREFTGRYFRVPVTLLPPVDPKKANFRRGSTVTRKTCRSTRRSCSSTFSIAFRPTPIVFSA